MGPLSCGRDDRVDPVRGDAELERQVRLHRPASLFMTTVGCYGDDFCVVEHLTKGAVTGEFLGIPGHGREVSFRLLHVWEFRDGLMSRENVWLDGGSVVAQLTA
jgi:hypothetical protein